MKRYYNIEIDNINSGFFALFRHILEYMYVADKFNLVPVVNIKNCLYKEIDSFKGTNNPFEYYFVQASDYKNETSREALVSNIEHLDLVSYGLTGEVRSYFVSEEYMTAMANICRKYIRLNDETEMSFNSSISRRLGNKSVLGVHVRGTDFNVGYKNHPNALDLEMFFEEIDDQLKANRWEKVFLATDDRDVLEAFKRKYRDLLLYYKDTYRESGLKSIAFSDHYRPHHKYLLGFEVLRDVYTLANCEGFIGGVSQVAICSRILRESMGEKYRFTKIIDKGILKNGIVFRGNPTQRSSSENKFEKTGETLVKFKEFYGLLNDWLYIKQHRGSLSGYFEINGYKRIAIQGMKELGVDLINELNETSIDIVTIIDKNRTEDRIGDIPVIQDASQMPVVDAIIVTAVHYYSEIKEEYSEVNCPIISLNDIVLFTKIKLSKSVEGLI